MSWQDMVEEFHRAHGIHVQPRGRYDLRDVDLRLSLIAEEFGELRYAANAEDWEGVIDGVVDLLYVALGAASTWGFRVDDVPHRVSRVFSSICGTSQLAGCLAKLHNRVVKGMYPFSELDELVREIVVYAVSCGIPIGPFFAEVHAANMRKVGGPKSPSGKQLKPDGWVGPDIIGVMERVRREYDADEAHSSAAPPKVRSEIHHPPHYTATSIEPIDVIEAWKLSFALGNTVKYIARAEHKGSQIEDLKKARWYLDREIKRLEGSQ